MSRWCAMMFFLVAIALSGWAEPTEFLNGEVVRVHDGDTLSIEIPGQYEWVAVRLYGIDSPETAYPEAQPFSGEAKQRLIALTLGKQVSVRLKGEETYDRVVGEVFVDGVSTNRVLIREGLAWWNKKYEPQDLDLERLEREARKQKLGLWSEPDPVPPWRHRR